MPKVDARLLTEPSFVDRRAGDHGGGDGPVGMVKRRPVQRLEDAVDGIA